MPKPTSKSTLALITQKLNAEQKVKDSIPVPIWAEKSPEHPRSPSTASEMSSATSEQNQKDDADNVSRVLNLESEDDTEGTGDSTEEETVASDSEKAKASEKPTKAKEREPEEPEPISLDELLKAAGVTKQERGIIQNKLSLWNPADLLMTVPTDIITKPEYCSVTARRALYTGTSRP